MTARQLPEWIGKTPDAKVPDRVRLRIFEKYDGRCQCGCNRKITTGERWQLDHVLALANGGEHREFNMRPLLADHHKIKTREDVAEKSRTYRRRAKHYGVRKAGRSFQTNRDGPFKKKITGEVVRR